MTEHRRAELRAEPGRRLVGTPMRYGAEARVLHPASGLPVRERFAAFAFMDYLTERRRDPAEHAARPVNRGGEHGTATRAAAGWNCGTVPTISA